MVCLHKLEGLAFTVNDETEKLSVNVDREEDIVLGVSSS